MTLSISKKITNNSNIYFWKKFLTKKNNLSIKYEQYACGSKISYPMSQEEQNNAY